MKMQLVTMKLNGNNFSIARKSIDTKNRCESDYASCNITVLKPMFCCKSGFIASGFSSFISIHALLAESDCISLIYFRFTA